MNRKSVLPILVAILILLTACVACQPLYTIVVLDTARANGVYETPEQGVIQRASKYYCDVERVEIEQAATNSFDGSNPHIWYVIWRVYAKQHAPCESDHRLARLHHGTYESGGNFYLNVKDGWVYMPEGYFPEVIGFWMKVLDLAGPGNPQHVPRFPE